MGKKYSTSTLFLTGENSNSGGFSFLFLLRELSANVLFGWLQLSARIEVAQQREDDIQFLR